MNIDALEVRNLHHKLLPYVKSGSFELSSGNYANIYFDMKSALCDNSILFIITKVMYDNIDPRTEHIGGMEFGAVPLIAALAFSTYFNPFYIRKQTRSHGLGGRVIRSKPIQGQITIIEDVVTTGHTIDECEAALINDGYTPFIKDILCIVDRTDGKYTRHEIKSIFKGSDFII